MDCTRFNVDIRYVRSLVLLISFVKLKINGKFQLKKITKGPKINHNEVIKDDYVKFTCYLPQQFENPINKNYTIYIGRLYKVTTGMRM